MQAINLPRFLVTVLALVLFTFVYEIVLHGHLLLPMYEATPTFWRTADEIKANMTMSVVRLVILAAITVLFYAACCQGKTLARGIEFGFWMGLLLGASDASAYLWMPLPSHLALAWLVSKVVYGLSAGVILGALYKGKV